MNAAKPLYITEAAAKSAAWAVIARRVLKGAEPVTRYVTRLGADRSREHGYEVAVRLRHGQIVPLSKLN